MRVTVVCLPVIVLTLVLAWPSSPLSQAPSPPVPSSTRREVRIGAPGVPAVIDPATALEGTIPLIARQVFDTLVAYREGTTDVDPGLATRWSVSRDGLTWSFTLRDGVKFHDGTPLTSAEVVASFERQLRPDAAGTAGVWSALFRGTPGVVREVRAPDPRTVQIVLVQPYAPLVAVLAHPGLGIVRSVTGGDGTARLIGTGAYRVVDASSGRLALEAAPGYWAVPPKSERLVFLEVGGDDQAEAELDSRTLDVWFPPGPPRRTEGALSLPGLRVGYLAFQTEKEPFSRKKVRQAVAAALDPVAIGVALDRAGVPLQSFLPPGVWARREGSPILGGSRRTVRTLLVEGGWSAALKPTLLVPSEESPVNLPKVAEAIQVALGAQNIRLALRTEPLDVAHAILQKGEHDVALLEAPVTAGDPHLFLFPLSTSEAASKGPRALNFSFYRSPALDGALIRASQLTFRAERQRLYQRAQALLAQELPWLPIYVRLNWALARGDIRGLRLHPTGFHRLDTVTLETAAGGLR
jgi:peptide/nickel transport system substrate-binding protein